MIEEQQAAATEILRIAEKAGLIVTVWTVEDAKEACERAYQWAQIAKSSEELEAAGAGLLDQCEEEINDSLIAQGWSILNTAASNLAFAEAER